MLAPSRQVTGKVCHPERNARDLRSRFLALLETRISPGVYPEPDEGVEMTIRFYLCAFASLREIFRILVAASPRWASNGSCESVFNHGTTFRETSGQDLETGCPLNDFNGWRETVFGVNRRI